MDRHGPELNRLDSVPGRPHRLLVIIPVLAMLAALGLIYRYAGARWPGNATRHGPIDISETDSGHRDGASPLTVVRHRPGATPAAGFHRPPQIPTD
jgi:hypothetical protein